MEILRRDTLNQGGFAGVREHRMVKAPFAFGPTANNDGSWSGIGNFVYLADARFAPHGETHMHSHHEVDVISVMVEGRIAHQGSLGHGQDLNTHDVQVQRAGEQLSLDSTYLAYLTKGTATANGEIVQDGDLLRGDYLQIEAQDTVQLIVIQATTA